MAPAVWPGAPARWPGSSCSVAARVRPRIGAAAGRGFAGRTSRAHALAEARVGAQAVEIGFVARVIAELGLHAARDGHFVDRAIALAVERQVTPEVVVADVGSRVALEQLLHAADRAAQVGRAFAAPRLRQV